MKTPSKTHMTVTNATNHGIAQHLKDHGTGCTFSAILYTKVGTRGKGKDTVCDTIVTGFSYEKLLKKDRTTIRGITAQELHEACVAADKRDKDGAIPDLAACAKAIADHTASIDKSLAGTNDSTTDAVRDPLIVGTERVPGCWVNNGSVDETKRGIVYIYGLKVGRKVITRDPSRPTPTKSRADVVAKGVLKTEFLRIGRWVQMKLAPGTEYYLKLGGEAVVMATEHGITELDGVTVREAFEASA